MKKLGALIGALILAILSLAISLTIPVIGIVFIVAVVIISCYLVIRVIQEDDE